MYILIDLCTKNGMINYRMQIASNSTKGVIKMTIIVKPSTLLKLAKAYSDYTIASNRDSWDHKYVEECRMEYYLLQQEIGQNADFAAFGYWAMQNYKYLNSLAAEDAPLTLDAFQKVA